MNGICGKCSETPAYQYSRVHLFHPASLWLSASAEDLSSCCRLAVVAVAYWQNWSVEPGNKTNSTKCYTVVYLRRNVFGA